MGALGECYQEAAFGSQLSAVSRACHCSEIDEQGELKRFRSPTANGC